MDHTDPTEDLIDDHVESLHSDLLILLHHAHGQLAGNAMATLQELPLQRGGMDTLEEAMAERVIYFVEGANDAVRQSLVE